MRGTLSPRHVPARVAARLAGAALLAALVAGAASADTVVLTNGRRLKGTILSEDDKQVVLQTDGMGKMKLARSDVKEIVRSGDAPPALNPGPEPAPDPAPAAKTPDATPPARDPARDPAPAAPPQTRRPPGAGPAAIVYTPQDRTVLEGGGPWKVEKGPIADVLASLARQAGLSLRTTPVAAALLPNAKPCARGFESDAALGPTIDGLLRPAVPSALVARVHAGELIVGRPWEIAGAAPQVRGHGISWEDARGDLRERLVDGPGWRRPDVTRVSIEGRDGTLVLNVAFDDDVRQTLGQKTAEGVQKSYQILDVYLDLDDDPTTGGAPSIDPDCGGYETRITLVTGMKLQDPSSGALYWQWGNALSSPGKHTVLDTPAKYRVSPMAASGGPRLTVDDGSGKSPEDLTTIAGTQITALVPYTVLGLRPGARVRAACLDCLEDPATNERTSQAGTVVVE